MTFKLIAVLSSFSIISAIPLEYGGYKAAPVFLKSYSPTSVKYDHVYKQVENPAEYNFSYAVNDAHTGDIKSQQESRKGNTVQGRYEMLDADGHRRIVEYTADEHTGFNAVVHREPLNGKDAHALTVHTVAPYTAPIDRISYNSRPNNLAYAASPIQHHKPIATNFF